MLSLESGVAAGGEMGSVRSAGLLVVHEQPWPLVDLRVDWDEQSPVSSLRRIWDRFQPQMADYVTRALNPAAAPAYGVPGDRSEERRVGKECHVVCRSRWSPRGSIPTGPNLPRS